MSDKHISKIHKFFIGETSAGGNEEGCHEMICVTISL